NSDQDGFQPIEEIRKPAGAPFRARFSYCSVLLSWPGLRPNSSLKVCAQRLNDHPLSGGPQLVSDEINASGGINHYAVVQHAIKKIQHVNVLKPAAFHSHLP